MTGPLHTALQDYDGRHTDVLEWIRDGIEPVPPVLDEAIVLAADPQRLLADGATWVLRAWVEGGADLDAAAVGRLARILPRIAADHARQHVCQIVRRIDVPARHAAAFAVFLENCRQSPRPFLRAWAVDGLYRLAVAHPRYAAEAELALRAAREDPAASVRARVRRIEAGD